MDIFKRKTDENIPEGNNDTIKQNQSISSSFKNSIKIDDQNEKLRILKLKKDYIEGKIEEKNLSNEELDEITKLLEGEIAQNDIKLQNLKHNLTKYKKNN